MLHNSQKIHSKNISNSLSKNKTTYDISDVGTGKTYTTCSCIQNIQHTLNKFKDYVIRKVGSDINSEIFSFFQQPIFYVFCPLSLKSKWKEVSNKFSIEFKCIESHQKILNYTFDTNKPITIILDEGHVIRNDNKISNRLLYFLRKYDMCKILVISSTLLDTEQQKQRLINYFELSDKNMFKMKSLDNLTTSIIWCFRLQSKLENTICYDIFRKINAIVCSVEEHKESRNPIVVMASLNKYIKKLHVVYTPIVIEHAKSLLELQNCKIVIITPFLDVIDSLHAELGGIKMYGKDKEKERDSKIRLFMQNDNQYRIFITNARIGSVGIDLDDKYGNRPRHLIYLPTYSSIDLFQSIGRIRRRTTYSNTFVHIINNKVAVKMSKINLRLKEKLELMSNYTDSQIPKEITKSIVDIEPGDIQIEKVNRPPITIHSTRKELSSNTIVMLKNIVL